MAHRIAVISDVHANLAALEAVLAAIDDEGVEEIWCLGDTVGYGPRPNECCQIVQERATLCLLVVRKRGGVLLDLCKECPKTALLPGALALLWRTQ